MKVIQFKNKKLTERLEQRQTMEDELREKIEKLEKRQATDDTTLLIVNRYWSEVRAGHDSSGLCRKIVPQSVPPCMLIWYTVYQYDLCGYMCCV